MKVYLNKEYKCVKVEDNTFVANDSSNYIRYYFVTNANGDVIDKMDDTSVIYRNTEPSYVTVAFRRADGDVIQHLMASPKTDATGKSFFEYEITNTDGVLYKKGALEISAQFIEATLSEAGGVKKVISQKVKAVAINTAHVLDNIGEEAEEYYSQYEQANNDAHAVLQAQITTNFNNIGTLQELTTDAKDDLVKAINEVDAHADANKSEIGDLSNLTTDEKTTIVGAINEVDAHSDANKTEIGNLSALTTDEKATLVGAINEVDNHADNAIGVANNAVATANGAVATANEAKTTAQTAETNANNAVDKATEAQRKAQEAITKAANNVYAVGFMTLQEAITAVNGYDNTVLKTNDNILVVAQGSPDLYVTSVEATNIPYNFTTVDKFNDDLVKNTVLQIGYYKVAFYETDGQPVTVAYQNVVVKSTDWVASTEFADFPYEAKIELTDFVDYTTVPQVVFDIADTMSGNYAPICKSGDKCVYIYGKVQDEITLKTVITFAPNVNGASVTGGGYNNRGKWVASTTYAIDDLVYTDNGQYVCIEGITSTTSPEQDTQHWQATFVATGKTKNGLKFSGQDNGTGVQKTFDGSTAVEIAFDENTMTAKEVNGVLKVGAKGTVPEALPATGAKITGELPTSGWASDTPFWEGSLFLSQNTDTLLLENIPTPTSNIPLTVTAFLRRGSATTPYGTVTESGNAVYNADTGEVIWYGYFTISERGYNYSNEIKLTFKDNKLYAQCTYSQHNASYAAITLNSIASTEIAGVPRYTISNSAIKTNSTVSMYLNSADEVRTYSKTDGSVVVEMDAVPTVAIHYTLQVVETSAEGAFEIINSYVPSIPDSPTSLPVTYKKASGNLPTSGWEEKGYKTFWEGDVSCPSSSYKLLGTSKELADILYADSTAYPIAYCYGRYMSAGDMQFSYIVGDVSTPAQGKAYRMSRYSSDPTIVVTQAGDIYAKGDNGANTSQAVTYKRIGASTISQQFYTISDTSITANTSVKMYLTDAGGVKAQSKASGSITVIRDTVPTVAIPYEYEVEQTSAEGLFEVINAYVPTKTSDLQNDSGFITAADIPSAGEWVDVTGETATLTQAGTYQVIASVNDMQSIVYWDGSTVAYGTKSTTPSVSTSGGTAYLFINCAYPQIDASGTLSVHLLTAGNSSGAWTETDTVQSGFKYRKIN